MSTERIFENPMERTLGNRVGHFIDGVATMSRLLKIIRLFCRILSLLQGSFTLRDRVGNLICQRMRLSHSFRLKSAQHAVKPLEFAYFYVPFPPQTPNQLKNAFIALISAEVRPTCSKTPRTIKSLCTIST